MFTPVKEFKHNGYYYNEEADTHVLEYLYPIANYYCPDFSGEYDDEGEPIYEHTQAVKRFVARYNYAIKQKEVSTGKTDFLEKAKRKASKYYSDDELKIYIKNFNLDPDKFWYLLLFIYDYCIGKCVDNLFVEEKTTMEQLKKLTDAIFSNHEILVGSDGKAIFRTKEAMILSVKIGDNEYAINSHTIIRSIALFCVKEKLCTDPQSPLFLHHVQMDKSRPERDTILVYSFASMFTWFFQNNNFSSYKRRKNAKLTTYEKGFILRLIHFLNIDKKLTIDNMEKICQRKQNKIFHSSNGYYFM